MGSDIEKLEFVNVVYGPVARVIVDPEIEIA